MRSTEIERAETAARIEIADFDITAEFIDHAGWHGISADQVYAVLDHYWVVKRNRGQRAATHILYGTDNAGSCLAIPLLATEDPYIWRPVTARPCKKYEAAYLHKGRS